MSIDKLTVGDDLNGSKIKNIIQQSVDAIVVFNETGALGFRHARSERNLTRIINKFHELDTKIPDDIPSRLYETLQRELGAAFYCAMVCEDEKEGLTYLDKISDRINKVKTRDEAKLILIITTFIILGGMGIYLVYLQQLRFLDNDNLYLCMLFGGCGAFFSLLNRNDAVQVNLVNGDFYIYLQSFIIALTGVLSGLIVFIFSKANIAFGFTADNVFTLFAICLVSGFSERFVPDLFSKVKVEK